MNAIGRKLAFLFLGGLLATAATLTFPAPATAAPPYITIGVHSGPGGVGAPDGMFQTVVPGAPPFAPVTIDFSGCTHFWLSAVQPVPPFFAPIVVGCGGHTVTSAANAAGVATFRIVGSSSNPNGATLPPSPCPCAVASSGALPLGAFCISTVDHDNLVGVGAADIASVITDILYSQTHLPLYFARSDYDNDGDTDAADLGLMIQIFLNLVASGTNGSSCGDPGGACCAVIP